MRLTAFLCAFLLALPAAAETRCGWLHNPTPGNWWLTDAQREWTLATQGGEEAEGMDALPDISARDYVRTNGHYGYACACLSGDFDAGAGRATRIAQATQKPLAACRRDKALPKP